MENTITEAAGTAIPETQSTESKCPVAHGARKVHTNADWWPNQLNLKVLHQNSPLSDPMGEKFDYAKEFKSLDLKAVIKDLNAVMTNSQEWWPAEDLYAIPLKRAEIVTSSLCEMTSKVESVKLVSPRSISPM